MSESIEDQKRLDEYIPGCGYKAICWSCRNYMDESPCYAGIDHWAGDILICQKWEELR